MVTALGSNPPANIIFVFGKYLCFWPKGRVKILS